MNNIFISSKTAEWMTPDWLYKQLDDEFHFQFDIACISNNQKCKFGWGLDIPTMTVEDHGKWIHYGGDSLKEDWWKLAVNATDMVKSIWCNPPYNNLKGWIEKGYEASLHGCTVVFLLPTTKLDQSWWHEIVIKHATDIRFIEGRVKFGGAKSAAPFPSVIVVFKPNTLDWEYKSIRKCRGK